MYVMVICGMRHAHTQKTTTNKTITDFWGGYGIRVQKIYMLMPIGVITPVRFYVVLICMQCINFICNEGNVVQIFAPYMLVWSNFSFLFSKFKQFEFFGLSPNYMLDMLETYLRHVGDQIDAFKRQVRDMLESY